jgi:DNA-binding HxlR family transcriptional regulator
MALLDLLGRSWAMGILWVLAEHGPCGFSDLQRRCETISPGVLSTRVKELAAARLLVQDETGYALSARGRELFSLLEPLGTWARDWARHLTGSRFPERRQAAESRRVVQRRPR